MSQSSYETFLQTITGKMKKYGLDDLDNWKVDDIRPTLMNFLKPLMDDSGYQLLINNRDHSDKFIDFYSEDSSDTTRYMNFSGRKTKKRITIQIDKDTFKWVSMQMELPIDRTAYINKPKNFSITLEQLWNIVCCITKKSQYTTLDNQS